MDITGELLLITGLAILNGALAMSEIALVSARTVRLRQRADAGDKGAKVALELAASPGNLLSTVQVGITLIGILAGALGGANLATKVGAAVGKVPLLAPYSDAIGMGLVVALITYLSLILGELVPKQLALNSPERIAATVARPLKVLSSLSRPLVFLLDGSSKILLRLLGTRPPTEPPVTIEELEHLLKLGTKHGVFNEGEHEIVARALRLGSRQVGELVTPRSTMVALDANAPIEANLAKIAASPHSYFPVYEEVPDRMVGVVSVKSLWLASQSGEGIDLRRLLVPAVFLPEGMSAVRALARMRQKTSNLALVIDEFGGIEGLVTLNDVLRAIVGELPAPEQEGPGPVPLGEDVWELDGMFYMPDLKKMISLAPPEIEELESFRTLSGFVMAKLRRVATPNDRFRWANLDFEVRSMNDRRIEKVLLTRVPKLDADEI